MRVIREAAVFLFYLALAIAFTWPLAPYINTAVADPGDPLITAFIIDWVCHSLTSEPSLLFDAPIFYPTKYPLALSEHLTGLALLVLPFHLAGLGAIAVHNIALLLSFALAGYGAFVLARLVTGNLIASLAAGVFHAFVPFKFDHLSHVQLLANGWLPLVLAALLAFWRTGRSRHAALLGAAFIMNGLSNTYYLLFAGFALAMTILFLSVVEPRNERLFRRRLVMALAGASLVLLPFLIPYQVVSTEYRMKRNSMESARASATLRDWLTAPASSALYAPLAAGSHHERRVFPGVLAIAMTLCAAVMTPRRVKPAPRAAAHVAPASAGDSNASGRGRRVVILRAAAIVFAIVGCVVAAAGRITAGSLSFTGSDVPFTLAVACAIASLPLRDLVRRSRFSPELWAALLWIAIGFVASLGENSFLHSFLFRVIEPFRATRAPARWAVIAYTGLAVWMAWGVVQLQRRWGAVAGIVVLVASIGEMVPRIRWSHIAENYAPVYHWLARTRPRAAIELPIGWDSTEVGYVFAATLHRVPIMNGVSGFDPPLHDALGKQPYDAAMLDLIAENGATVAIIHPEAAERSGPWIASGRLRLLSRFDDGTAAYAIVPRR